MSDLERVSALHGHVMTGRRLGANSDLPAGIRLRERRLSVILQLNGAPAGAAVGKHIKGLKPATRCR